jgi:uncharacterized protein YbjT (DUF2867 family)
VVVEARARGHEVVELARSKGVDLSTGAGLEDRISGCDALVDVTNAETASRAKAEALFGAITRNLLAAEQQQRVGHHVLLSIVGIDDVPYGYYFGKRLQERLLSESQVPWTVLRATQFHEFAGQVLHFAKLGPFSAVPRMLSQPVAVAEVATALVDAVEQGPSGRLPDLAGPEQLQMVDMARRFSRARGLGRRVVPLFVPGAVGRGMRNGALCPSTDGPRGRITFDDWLAS